MPADLERLTTFLSKRQPAAPANAAAAVVKFDAAHLLWYAGALIVIGAMGIFSTAAFSQMGGRSLTVCAIIYAIAFTVAGHHLWHRKNLQTPGGLLIAVAVSMAPLAVYGIQDELGWWSTFGKPGTVQDFYVWMKGSWIFMEIAAIVAGVIALHFYRFPFIVSIIAVALWFMSMDLTPWIFNTAQVDWEMRRKVSVWFGLGSIILAWIADYRERGDFAFWLHLFGLMAFWGGITATESSSEAAKALYCLLNVGLLLLAVILMRRAYAVFGTLGICIYLGHLADEVFKDSLLFPFALSPIGIAVIAVGLLYHRKQGIIAAWLTAHLPGAVLRLRPANAR
jgi:hypothetical protein